MFEVTVYEQSFSSVAGAKSLLNSLLRSNPYLSTPLGSTPEEAAAGPPGESARANGVINATATPAAVTLRLLRRGRQLPAQRCRLSRSGTCLSNTMYIPPTRLGRFHVGGIDDTIPSGGNISRG